MQLADQRFRESHMCTIGACQWHLPITSADSHALGTLFRPSDWSVNELRLGNQNASPLAKTECKSSWPVAVAAMRGRLGNGCTIRQLEK